MGCGRGSPFRVRVGMTRGPVAIRGSSQAALQVGAAQAWGVPKIGLSRRLRVHLGHASGRLNGTQARSRPSPVRNGPHVPVDGVCKQHQRAVSAGSGPGADWRTLEN
jgi:hypothetical protein